MIKKVTLSDLEKSFGIKKNKFSSKFLQIYKTSDFKYKEINENEEQKLIKLLIEKTINDKRETGSKKRKIVWQKGWNENLERFKKNPKPMYYNFNLLEDTWKSFKDLYSLNDEDVEPREFAIYAFEKAINARQPKYEAISQNWGVSVAASEVSNIRTCSDFNSIIARALANKD
jgi:hypothetical protein